ncbi:hypothetical protein TI39_contig347g00009 [Zymoseptoria brevis]|uniref:Uncharacterized protein n=1 Tax=Zymoseptoria brevis TaxID=1047168 RepID=A0A0F4GUR7_9PEZI|nr:hypothetical protein TI39_contig347g00009 [Zymoseptoria brevis]
MSSQRQAHDTPSDIAQDETNMAMEYGSEDELAYNTRVRRLQSERDTLRRLMRQARLEERARRKAGGELTLRQQHSTHRAAAARALLEERRAQEREVDQMIRVEVAWYVARRQRRQQRAEHEARRAARTARRERRSRGDGYGCRGGSRS